MRIGCIASIVAIAFVTLAPRAPAAEKVTIALNWVPEPEFGGVYAAKESGAFEKHGLDVTIKPGGAGTPTWQMVAAGQVDFAVSSADEVVIARANGADVVAVFTIYQKCPQGIMTHAARGFDSIDDVFNHPGTLAMEAGLPYGKFLQKKYGFDKVKRIAYAGGITNFLADPNFSQQCFVFSEPVAARQQGADPEVFLIADAGYDPYTGVIICRGDTLKDKPDVVKGMVAGLREGWRAYLDDPKPANEVMGKINKAMDARTFAEAAEAQAPLIESKEETARNVPLGVMMPQRWRELIDQLVDLAIVPKDKAPQPEQCFNNPLGPNAS